MYQGRFACALACTTLIMGLPEISRAAEAPTASDEGSIGEVIVTARRREESLQDVPIAVTALSQDQLIALQVNSVKDIAAYAPGLNINSDSAGRSFVSIRGIGTTLINTVQPGVGIFLDGIYQPDTSYLNNPIVDVARIEVLRGPQGTLFGNNTLGGAINVVTRTPTDTPEAKVSGAYAGPDNYYTATAALSGPIVPGTLQGRIAVSDHSQNGFLRNSIAGSYPFPLNDRSLNTTLRFEPASFATLTFNGYYDRVSGGSTTYAHVTGPTDYEQVIATNENSTATLTYKGANLKGVFDVTPIATKITAVAAYDLRDEGVRADGDFGAIDFLRTSGGERLETRSGELRFDTTYTDELSSLIGSYASREKTATNQTTLLVPFALAVPSSVSSENNTQAVFGTGFWKHQGWEVSAGIRYDHQVLDASSAATAGEYKASQWDGRLTLTRHWDSNFMSYASVARGFRGGGQNGPGAPNLLYKGDSVVTWELGSKFEAPDHRLSIDADVFFNNYAHFIGQNSLAPSTSGPGFVAINLNSGHVKSYGFEMESHYRVTDHWRLDAGLTLLHARINNDSEYVETTGTPLASDRILFTPDWNYNLNSVYSVPVMDGRDAIDFTVGAVGKGNRKGSSLSPTVSPDLTAYSLVNASVGYRWRKAELALFATNLFNKLYFESYIDSSALSRAGLPAPLVSDVGLIGDRRRVGIRGSWSF